VVRRSVEESSLTDAARHAAHATFRRFRDEPDSRFYRAPGTTPEATWEDIREQVAATAAVAAVKGSRRESISPEDLTAWHRKIFGASFPEQCGRLRDHEESYGYVVGPRENPVVKEGRGTGWRRVPRRLREICAEFNREAVRLDPLTARQGLTLMDATRAAARLYAKLLSVHPFEDGNGRTSFVVLSYALVRVDAVMVELADHAELQWALGRALQPGGRRAGIEPLAELLAEKIRNARERDLS
jgi:fido (protein-threonine AMPylation protein)